MRLAPWSLRESAISVASAARLGVNDLLMSATRWERPPSRPLKILIVQLAHIGDCVLTTGVVASLCRTYPQHRVDVLASSATRELFEGLDGVGAIYTIDPRKYWRQVESRLGEGTGSLVRSLREERYQVIVNLRSHPLLLRLLRPGVRWVHGLSGPLRERRAGRPFLIGNRGRVRVRHALESFQKALERIPLPCPVDGPQLALAEEHEQAVSEHLPGLAAGDFMVMHPCAYWEHKSWPFDRFARLGEMIWKRYRLICVVVGSPKDRDRVDALKSDMAAPVINVAGRFRLKDTACLIRRARLFVGMDSGPMHLAGAVGTPALALFGPADPDLYRPWGCRQVVLHHPFPCGPCWHRQCLFPAGSCLSRISVEEAWSGVVDLLEGRGEHFPATSHVMAGISRREGDHG